MGSSSDSDTDMEKDEVLPSTSRGLGGNTAPSRAFRAHLTPSPIGSSAGEGDSSDSDTGKFKKEKEEQRKRRLAFRPSRQKNFPKKKKQGLVLPVEVEEDGPSFSNTPNKRKSDQVIVDTSDSDDEENTERLFKRTCRESPATSFSQLTQRTQKSQNRDGVDESSGRTAISSSLSSQPTQKTQESLKKGSRQATAPRRAKRQQQNASRSTTSSQPSPSFQGSDSAPGVIKTLHLQNFMCHTNFTHNFHSNLNFITGQNGSGKSALLSGILVALGGKASVTSRTTSLKSLVQKGKNTFRVSVTLLNTRGLPRYGDELTIERYVNASGSGGYRIKTVGGVGVDNRWRPLKKFELQGILAGLNIQIDNPVAILNQEVARSFLRSKDPKVKFNLFYDGTLLSKLENTLEETEVDLQETRVILKRQRQAIFDSKREIKELQAKVNKIDELNKMKDKIHSLHNEYLWAIVAVHESEKDKAEAAVALNAKELEVLTKTLNTTKESLQRLNEDTILAEQNEVRQKLGQKKTEFEQLKAKFTELKKEVGNLQLKMRTAIGGVKARESQITKLSGQIEKLKQEQEAKAQEETLAEQEKLTELQDRKKHLESVSVILKQDADSFQQTGEEVKERMQELQRQERLLVNRMELKRNDVANLGKNGNKYAVFGRKMEQLVAKIEANKHRFRKPPRGPLGSCFRVKDPRYAALVEQILRSLLDSFVVDNGNDLNLMKQLINSVYTPNAGASQRRESAFFSRSPGIIVSPFGDQLHDISRHNVTIRQAPSLFDMIKADNDDHVVLNVLIDTSEIERVLLFETNEAACQVLMDESRFPRSLKMGYSRECFRIVPSPHYAVRVMAKVTQAKILQSGRDQEAVKRELLAEIEAMQAEVKKFAPQKAELKAEISNHQTCFDKKIGEYQQTRRQLGETSNELKRHMDRMMDRQRRFDFNSFNEELDELKADLAKQEEARDNATREFEERKPKLLEVDQVRQALIRELEQLNTQYTGFNDAREEVKTKREKILTVLKKIQDKVSRLRSVKDELQGELTKKEADVDEKTQAAKQSCKKRIDTNRSPDSLRKEFKALQLHIKETESHLGDQEALCNHLAISKRRYNEMMKAYTPVNDMLKLITEVVSCQREQLLKQKSHIGRTLTLMFSALAKQRGYEGRLFVDYETKELYYFVCPDGDSFSKTLRAIDAQQSQCGNRTAEQAKQNKLLKKTLVEYSLGLSGGERSYSTICFILSLWQVMECPFYMLDEFDVFMDAFNRKTSQTALISHAQQFSRNQFVLFTPLDIGEIQGLDESSVLKLYPPVRGRQTGGKEGPSNLPSGSSARNGGETGGRQRNTNRNSEDCVENVDPVPSSSSGKSRRNKGQVLAAPN